MKKFIVMLAFVAGTIGAASAQVDGKAMGIRLGSVAGDGAEISYQHPFGNYNRMEFDLGINHYGFGFNGIYQWVWDLSAISNGFNWYAGVGAGLGAYDYDRSSTALGLCALGQIGIEYNFNVPLQLSLDYRPAVYVIPATKGAYDGICLSVRYKFR